MCLAENQRFEACAHERLWFGIEQMQQHPGECATTEPLSEAFGWVGPEQGPAAEQDCKEFMSVRA